VVAQLVQDFVHLERGGQRLDEDRRLERARASSCSSANEKSRSHRPLCALQLRQIERGVEPAFCALRNGTLEAEVEQRAGGLFAADEQMRC